MPKADYLEWRAKHADWVALLDKLRRSEDGFSFNAPNPPPHPGVKAEDGAPYLKAVQTAEAKAVVDARPGYDTERKTLDDGMKDYRTMGQAFHDEVTDPHLSMEEKEELLVLSEENDHLFHNAAVLWLEQPDSKPDSPVKPRAAAAAVSSQPSGAGPASAPNTVAVLARQDYEDVLKHLWFREIVKQHPHWDPDQWVKPGEPPERFKAMAKHTTGHDLGKGLSVLTAGEKDALKDSRLASHVTLGKVILRRWTQFHADNRIRVHPGFWGLYWFSPINKDDRGFYKPAPDKDSDTVRWLDRLAKLGMESEKYRQRPGEFQVYEKVPRLFGEVGLTPPGVYLHRSKAHGRDDFLVLVTGKTDATRKTMVACTKGCGAEASFLTHETAGRYTHADEFKRDFNEGKTFLPFACPGDDEKTFDIAGSWANMGFCVAWGKGHIEVAMVDYFHFGAMHDAVRAASPLGGLVDGFVEPFVCIELAALERIKERLNGRMKAAIAKSLSGYPVQVVTLAPCETSLRLYKRKSVQDYDYECSRLEALEWERCYRNVELPHANDIAALIQEDLKVLRARVEDVHFKSLLLSNFEDEISASVPQKVRALKPQIDSEARAEVARRKAAFLRANPAGDTEWSRGEAKETTTVTTEITQAHKKRLTIEEIDAKYNDYKSKKLDQDLLDIIAAQEAEAAGVAAQLTDQCLVPTSARLLLAFKIMHGTVAAYVAFLNEGWATDSYTGSFSGRNYNSGPRDSNEWGPFARPSAKSDESTYAGEGPLAAFIDLSNILQALGSDLFWGLSLLTPKARYGLELSPQEWTTAMLEGLVAQEDCLMWADCALERYSKQLTAYFTGASQWLSDLVRSKTSGTTDTVLDKLTKAASDPDHGEQLSAALSAELCSQLRRQLKATAGDLPRSIQAVIRRLND